MNHVTKNLNLTLLAWLLCTLVAPACFAAGGDHGPGNGGDVVVCRNAAGAIRSVELLDLYEGRTRWGNVADLGGPGLSVPEKVSLLLTRLGNRLPALEKFYRDWYATFEQETLSLSGVQLVDIPDSEHIALPVGCAIEQIAIQKEPQFPREKRYT
ncbi:MAG: hypothetical protein NDJ90_01520, partial [Oligoflexia bacterium]|nr:hypothetical protein [Oligoflexia bacterium]